MKNVSHIIFFDGECNFCRKIVDFVYRSNSKRTIYYSSLQSKFSHLFLPKKLLKTKEYNTIYYYAGGVLYKKSTAILQILKTMDRPYKYLSVLLIIPSFIRDYIYMIISKNRHKLARSTKVCRTISNKNYNTL